MTPEHYRNDLIERGWISAVSPLTESEKEARRKLAIEPDWHSLDYGYEVTRVGFPARRVTANGMMMLTLKGIKV